MALRLFLPKPVHAVRIGDDLVFLDVAADAYFCLADGARTLSLEPGGAVLVRAEAAARDLLEAGLLTEVEGPVRRSLPPSPQGSLRGWSPSKAMPAARILKALAVTLTARRHVERRDFADLLRPCPISTTREGPSPDLVEAVTQFERLRPWLPIDGQCLARSYHLRAFLRANGFDALWVFGVRTWPFAAHCWLQLGTTALDEDLERLSAYAPILAV